MATDRTDRRPSEYDPAPGKPPSAAGRRALTARDAARRAGGPVPPIAGPLQRLRAAQNMWQCSAGHQPYEGKTCWPCYKQDRRAANGKEDVRTRVRGEPPSLVVDDEWRQDAACRYPIEGLQPDDWFNDKRWASEASQRAKVVCEGCPVQRACLAYAIDTRQPWGVWGGQTAAERGVTSRQQRAG